MEVRTKKLFKELVRKLAFEILDEEDLDEVNVTGNIAGYETPHAFAKKKKKQKKIGVNEDLNSKDLDVIKKLIRDVVGDIYRDIWLKRNSWK